MQGGITLSGSGKAAQESEPFGSRLHRIHLITFGFVILSRFVATLRGHVGAVYRLAWSADSRQLVSASKDSTLKV